MRVLILLYMRPYSSLGTDATDATDGHLHSPQEDKSNTHARPQQNAFSAGTPIVLLHLCPHIYFVLICVSSYYYIGVCRNVSSYYYIRVCCICVLVLLHTCLLYVCPRTTIYVSVVCVSSYYYIRDYRKETTIAKQTQRKRLLCEHSLNPKP